MSLDVSSLIQSLNKSKLIAECPHCGDEFALSKALLFDGRVCNHKKFNQFDLKDIAFGHIVSQRWTDSFTFLLDKRDHPDNLYLTCKNCNSSLNDQFPDAKLRAEIEKQGTIGDWLREYEHEIREI